MKRQMLIIPLLALLLIILQMAVGGGKTQAYSNMEVLKNNDHVLVLRPLWEDGKLDPGKEYTILKRAIIGRNIPYMVPGYHVRMVYNDSTPEDSSIDHVYQFYILDKDGEVITRDNVPGSYSFADEDFSSVDLIKLTDAHTGSTTAVIDSESIREITDFIRRISGKNGVSGKGCYGGSLNVAMYDTDISSSTAVFSVTFGDSDSFFHGLYADGYPIHYDLDGIGISAVIQFLTQYT